MDFDEALAMKPGSVSAETRAGVKMLAATIRLSADDADQLTGQLVGRLRGLQDVLVVRDVVRGALASALTPDLALVPAWPCLLAPTGAVIATFASKDELHWVDVSPDGRSVALSLRALESVHALNRPVLP